MIILKLTFINIHGHIIDIIHISYQSWYEVGYTHTNIHHIYTLYTLYTHYVHILLYNIYMSMRLPACMSNSIEIYLKITI